MFDGTLAGNNKWKLIAGATAAALAVVTVAVVAKKKAKKRARAAEAALSAKYAEPDVRLPINVMVGGAPLVGKSTVVQALSDEFGLNGLNYQDAFK